MSERTRMATADLADVSVGDHDDEDRDDDRALEVDADGVETDDHVDRTDRLEPLLEPREGEDMRQRWHGLQAAFVDDPRRTVEQADELVAEVMQRLAQMFAHEREVLEGQWSSGNDVSTEDLRVALQRYRSFFERLLAA